MTLRSRRERFSSAGLVGALHALLLYALLSAAVTTAVQPPETKLLVFDVAQPPPPAPVEQEKPKAAPTGEASAANLSSRAAPVAVPPPAIRLPLPTPIIAAHVPAQASETTTGASPQPGPGTGSGGLGNGLGSGGEGDGSGAGLPQVRAQWVRGMIADSDYPKSASRARAGGTVIVRFTVDIHGRAAGCIVSRSSGSADLDATTCRLIERRFRYRPARDAEGRPVPDLLGWKQVWWLEAPR